MSDIIQNLLNDVLDDGARPTKYRAKVVLPENITDYGKELDIMCKSTEIPTKTTDVINLKHKGRNIPIPGQERFTQSLNLTFYLDPKHKYKTLFEEWMLSLNQDNYNNKNTTLTEKLKIMQANKGLNSIRTSITLTQLNFDGDEDQISYKFNGVFPKELSQVGLGASSVSAISEFSVSFSYIDYEIIQIKEKGSNSNDLANDILGAVQSGLNDIADVAMGFLSNSSAGKKFNSLSNNAFNSANKQIQDAGKTVGTTVENFLG